MKRNILCIAALIAMSTLTHAQVVRIASWNLGWHIAESEVPAWVAKCSQSYKKNTATGRWDLANPGAEGTTVGWYIKESRAKLEGVDLAKMPPCGVYQSPNYQGIAVSKAAYQNRTRQLSQFIQTSVKPDVIAFQEVSGSASVREALGPVADQYNVCTFDAEYKVQRLAFAWRKQVGELAEPCKVVASVSLPDEPEEDRVRPALTMGLHIGGKLIRFMTVHLKSSCVSSLEKGKLDDPTNPACKTLQKQVRPLETAIETLASGCDNFVVFGDFNRNLWHELHEVKGSEALRSNGESQLTKPLPTGVLSRNLLKEVFDGDPGGPVKLVPITCSTAPSIQALCDAAKTTALSKDEVRSLAAPTGLGCRNPIGLDHFVVSSALQNQIKAAEKISLGNMGMSLSPKPGKPDPLLAVSDHCPIVMTMDFQ